jgi:hypothetical protein
MDETPIKAGVASPGKMKVAYFWPIYGELDEICFKFYPDRSAKKVGLNGYARKSARVRLRKPLAVRFAGIIAQ